MTSTDHQYFIITERVDYPRHLNPGRLCYKSKTRYTSEVKRYGSASKVNVTPLASYTNENYEIEMKSLSPLTAGEAELLLALTEDRERLKWFRQEGALQTALGLTKGTEVFVDEQGKELRGVVRYIGRLTEPRYPDPIGGTFFGIELQV